ncbi:MAG: glycoside hydrolase family 38 C-terminal domain-containing protein [Lentisphaeria bacterium]|jgi:alpha-mannosidase
MIKTEISYYEGQIRRWLNYLPSLFYPQSEKLAVNGATTPEPVPFRNLASLKFKPVQEGETWGGPWNSAWFTLSGTIPRDWKGKTVVARLNFGGEACVFSAAGEPLQGLTNGSVFNMNVNRERFPLASPCKGGEKVELLVEAAANHIFGCDLPNDPAPGTTPGDRYCARLEVARLCVFDTEVWHLFLEAQFLKQLMEALPERDPQRAQIRHALLKASNAFRYDAPNAAAVRPLLQGGLGAKADGARLGAVAVGHAHIDTAWLWPMRETVRKVARTFASQLRLIERYPGYVFGASQPQLYQFAKDHYPLLYKRIKKAVEEKRWELQGCMWVEADCNLPSGESLVRQVLYGKKFYKEEFNVDVRNLWLPDVFGYSAALPQILKQAGVDTFLTQKLSWNQFNQFPHHTFIWKGLDGTGILTHFPPENTYNSELTPTQLRFGSENFLENGYLPEYMVLFGIGDGGGGPLEDHIESGLLARDVAGLPKVQFGHAQEMFDRLGTHAAELPVWQGELYFELHRGTYTTQARNKRANRKLELALRRVEMLHACLPLPDYPAADLERLWKIVLTNQFHDIIPGSSITQVYRDSQREYAAVEKELAALEKGALARLASSKKKADTLTLVNTLSHEFQGLVHLPDLKAGTLETADGQPIPVQPAAQGGGWAAVNLPGLAAVEFTVRPGKAEGAGKAKVNKKGGAVLENELVRYEFNPEGRLCRAFDKAAGREVMRPGELGNVLSLYQDWPSNWDAWDIDLTYEQQFIANATLASLALVENGPASQALRLTWTVGASTIDQTIRLGANSRRLDFVTKADWRESRKMLRVAFPVDVVAAEATYEVQFGIVRRPTHRNTSWDWARFESCGHRFADLSDAHYGVALLNDCKFGYKICERTLDLNLLRSTFYPDPEADRGEQHFTYSLLPHPSRFEASTVLAEAHTLNQPPLVAAGSASFKLPLEIRTADVLVDAVKRGENGKDWVFRLYEPRGYAATCEIRPPNEDVKVWEAGILENTTGTVPVRNGSATLSFRPFEIKTLMVRQK